MRPRAAWAAGGLFIARAPVDGCVELADFATTFNNMAARLQTIDNSRGQFMGNIAHELRTPMTTIKGFIDGMLDGTIPQGRNQALSGYRLAGDGTSGAAGPEHAGHHQAGGGRGAYPRPDHDLWKTVTDVVLSDEQRIEDGKSTSGAGRRPAADLCRPRFCTSGRV